MQVRTWLGRELLKLRCEVFLCVEQDRAIFHPFVPNIEPVRDLSQACPATGWNCSIADCNVGLIPSYWSGVAVTKMRVLPLLSRESEEKTTVGFPVGISTEPCHRFLRII